MMPVPPSTTTMVSPKLTASRRQFNLLLAGGGAGVISKTVVAPLERVKIVCQTGASKGMVASFTNIWYSEGLWGYWRGNWAACVRILPHKGILFSCNDLYKDTLRARRPTSDSKLLTSSESFFAGACSGLTAAIMTYPLDFIRTRQSGKIGKDVNVGGGLLRTALETVRTEGPWALYRGIGPTVLGSIPYEGIKFATYDFVRQRALSQDEHTAVSQALVKVGCGGFAGLVATVLTYPNDTVRRRLQMQGEGGRARIYRDTIDCYQKLIRTQGIMSLYQGLTPTLLRALPNMGIQFSAYEVLRSFVLPPST